MKAMLGVAILVLTVAAWLFLERRRVRRQVESAFEGRACLSDEDFFATYYRESGIPKETVDGVRQVLASELQEDVSRVLPMDDFAGNLNFLMDSYSMTDAAVVEALEKRFGITISDQEAERMKTLHDIICLVHGKAVST